LHNIYMLTHIDIAANEMFSKNVLHTILLPGLAHHATTDALHSSKTVLHPNLLFLRCHRALPILPVDRWGRVSPPQCTRLFPSNPEARSLLTAPSDDAAWRHEAHRRNDKAGLPQYWRHLSSLSRQYGRGGTHIVLLHHR